MPELPEVETVVLTLAPHVVGQAIRVVSHLRADMVRPVTIDLIATLKDRGITHLTRRAKRIVFTLDDSDRFFIHLGMTGKLTLNAPEAPMKPHTHLVIDLAAGDDVGQGWRARR